MLFLLLSSTSAPLLWKPALLLPAFSVFSSYLFGILSSIGVTICVYVYTTWYWTQHLTPIYIVVPGPGFSTEVRLNKCLLPEWIRLPYPTYASVGVNTQPIANTIIFKLEDWRIATFLYRELKQPPLFCAPIGSLDTAGPASALSPVFYGLLASSDHSWRYQHRPGGASTFFCLWVKDGSPSQDPNSDRPGPHTSSANCYVTCCRGSVTIWKGGVKMGTGKGKFRHGLK